MTIRLRQRRSRLASWSWALALLSVPLVIAGALAHRFDQIATPTLYMLLAAAFLSAFAAVVAAIGAFRGIWHDGRSGFGAAVRGLLLGLLVLVIPVYGAWLIVSLPRLSDIVTDPVDPPTFALARLDAGPHPARPSEDELRLQQSTHPDIYPRRYPASPPRVFAEVRKLVLLNGWQILDQRVPAGPDESGRIEAVALTLAFAFRNDVVIRVTPDPEGSKVDMRSASRYAAHDLGANAERVKAFLSELDTALAGVVED